MIFSKIVGLVDLASKTSKWVSQSISIGVNLESEVIILLSTPLFIVGISLKPQIQVGLAVINCLK